MPDSSYPPDVQAYLECVSRWYRREVNGICYYDRLKKLNNDGSVRSYHPDPRRILEGVSVLKNECAKGNTLYFPRGHQFGQRALDEFPHYPWMAGLDWAGRGAITELVGSATGTAKVDHLAFLIIGNVRIGLPSNLAGPEENPYWVALIGAVYGGQHPSIIGSYPDRKNMYTDAQINLHLEYDVSEIGGTKTQDPYEVDPIPIDDEDRARGATTPRAGWDGWVEVWAFCGGIDVHASSAFWL